MGWRTSSRAPKVLQSTVIPRPPLNDPPIGLLQGPRGYVPGSPSQGSRGIEISAPSGNASADKTPTYAHITNPSYF